MSVMNFQKTFRDVKPPEKGSFPLDHEGSELSFENAFKSCMTFPEICQDLSGSIHACSHECHRWFLDKLRNGEPVKCEICREPRCDWLSFVAM